MRNRSGSDKNHMDEDETSGPEKKERVLHTRVSADFEEGLKRKATEMGTSVSGLVRHTLAHTFSGLDETMAEGGGAIEPLRVGWVSPAQQRYDDTRSVLLGWQELILNLNAVCVQCNAILNKGSKAAVAFYEGSGPRQFLCCGCLARLGEK